MNEEERQQLQAEKEQHSRNRIFGLLVIVALILLIILIYEIIVFAK